MLAQRPAGLLSFPPTLVRLVRLVRLVQVCHSVRLPGAGSAYLATAAYHTYPEFRRPTTAWLRNRLQAATNAAKSATAKAAVNRLQESSAAAN